jgi:hypothetical protein
MPEKMIDKHEALEAEVRLIVNATEKSLKRIGREITAAAAAKGTLLNGGTVKKLVRTLVEQLEGSATMLIAAHVKAGTFDAKEIATRVLSILDPISNDFLESHVKRIAGALQIPFESLRPEVKQFFDSLTDRATVALAEDLKATEIKTILKKGEKDKIAALINPSWWSHYHNHVYGVASIIGVVLTVLFFVWPKSKPGADVSNLSGQPASPSTQPTQSVPVPLTLPSLKARKRVFTNRTARELFLLYEGRTILQADGLMEPYKGQWIEVRGLVLQLIPDVSGVTAVLKSQPSDTINARFDKKWELALRRLNTGDMVTIRGKISENQNGQQLYLLECEF